MVKNLETGVEVKKVDSQGRLILPPIGEKPKSEKAENYMSLNGKGT